MRQPQTYTTWKIKLGSPGDCEAVQHWLADRISLARVCTQTVRAMPGGVVREETVPHRLGDYFAAIRALPDSQNDPASFLLMFQRLPDAGRYWKDLMVGILGEIEASPQRPAIKMEAKGEMEPRAFATAGSI
jgi:hypothetical protein